VPALASSVRTGAPTRRQRAGTIVNAALRGGVIAGIAALVAWLLATAIAGTAFVFLVAATLLVGGATVLRERPVSGTVWAALAAAWAVVILERAIVGANGGSWVAAAAWLGVIAGARRAGVAAWALPLLAYPLISVAVVVAAGQPLLHPWGVSWLWLLAVLGPAFGARVVLNPSPRDPAAARPSPRLTH
jgi:hypothetical protein